jgi:Outer membrane protein beta-barrel domain
MKRISLLVLLVVAMIAPSCLMAQEYDHAEVGVFADYFRLSRTDPQINFVGVGGRVGFNVSPHVALEGEMSYDFKRNFTSTFSNGVSTEFVNTDLRPLTALFGPKFQTGTSSPVRFFVTPKVGFVNFTVSNQSPGSGFQSALGAVTSGDTKFALYPGAGMEGFWGPFGFRLDVGDEIYFDNGARNNFKAEFGPVIRF